MATHDPHLQPPTDVLAIDGPAGAGKSSVSREVARRLGFRFLDSGAMYRAATWWAMENGVDWSDTTALVASTAAMPLALTDTPEGLLVSVEGRDISEAIRTPEVTRNIRHLDGIAAVREPLVAFQRNYARKGPTVAEGRDMGTVVFPNARCKIYLDASLECRTQRRADQMRTQGIEHDNAELRTEIAARDDNDRNREVSPLRQAPDAEVIDTSALTEEHVIETILELARKAFA